MTNLRLWGVSRAPDGQPTLILHFDRVPTDDEMRELHERLGSAHEPTCECKEQREAWICVKCGKPEASVPHGNPLDQMAAGAELYGDPATPGYKR